MSESCTTSEIVQGATTTIGNLLPKISKDTYEQCYQQFMDWRNKKNANSFSENVIIAYFNEISVKMKSSTLWKIYSMLKTTINVKHNVDLGNYTNLRAFLKRQSDGYIAKKSKTLTPEEIKEFINKAPDNIYLATKAVLIVGIMGACRKHELWQMQINHIQDLKTAVLISVPDMKTKVQRKFSITGHFYDIFKKYLVLRPLNVETNHLFLNYQKGRCTKQIIGINKFGSMPKQVATFLNLKNPELYTGHCFRRSSATMLIDDEPDITTLKSHESLKSTEIEESYKDNSINSGVNIANKIIERATSNLSNAPTIKCNNCSNLITINIIKSNNIQLNS